MKSVKDALYNWLTIKVVSDARPDDTAAKETTELFAGILKDEYHLTNISVTKDDSMYFLTYREGGESKSLRFPSEYIEITLNQINQHPERYQNYPAEAK